MTYEYPIWREMFHQIPGGICSKLYQHSRNEHACGHHADCALKQQEYETTKELAIHMVLQDETDYKAS